MKAVDRKEGNLDVDLEEWRGKGEEEGLDRSRAKVAKRGGQYAEQIRTSDGNSVPAPLLLLFGMNSVQFKEGDLEFHEALVRQSYGLARRHARSEERRISPHGEDVADGQAWLERTREAEGRMGQVKSQKSKVKSQKREGPAPPSTQRQARDKRIETGRRMGG